jgi:hypothetical protein
MSDDVQKYIYRALTIFITGVAVWVGFIFINACGFSLVCKQGATVIERTPIPTLPPATMPALKIKSNPAAASNNCRVAAEDLIGAWVSANSPETDSFQFFDVNGKKCDATFAEALPLFDQPNIWRDGSLACVSCHSVDVTVSPAQLDLSSYAGITIGSRREKAESKKGTDILGGGDWKKSLLYEFIVTGKADVPGHTRAAAAESFVVAGKPYVESASTPTATPKP